MAPRRADTAEEEEEEDHNNDQEEEQQHSRKRQRKGAVKLLEDSGMTEEARRQLRHKQRLLFGEIEAGPDNAEGGQGAADGITFLSVAREKNNECFDNVRFTREAVLDAENTTLIVEKTANQLDNLLQVPRFDADKLCAMLRTKLSSNDGEEGQRQFNWTLLGRECGVCFNGIPSDVRFMAGVIDMEGEKVVRKARGPRQKVTEDISEEIRPELLEKQGNADTLSGAEKEMKNLKRALRKRSGEEGRKKMEKFTNPDAETQRLLNEHATEVDGVKLLFNPRSFTQTVENIFNASFLVKKKEAAIGVRPLHEKDGVRPAGLWLKDIKTPKDGESTQASSSECTQAVISFTMADWRRICEAAQHEESDMPHRTGSRHEKRQRVAASQEE